jgi:NAD(P)H-dependent flavin oxidoreductase YrpB (nitropropane dioxygenase family)
MDRLTTPLCDTLGIDYPIVQAGMGRGTVELAAAVCNAGGLGTIGLPETSSSPREMRDTLEHNLDELTSRTDGNFAVNCYVMPPHKLPQENVEALTEFIDGVLVNKLSNDDVSDQLKVLETSGGSPEPWIDDINSVKEQTDLLHFHKVGSVKHAKKAEELGVDGITASGFEMAGHTHHPDDAVHSMVLVPSVVDAVDVPVLASGGYRDGRGLLAALSLGAQGVYMGSRFVMTQECDFHENYKEALREAEEGDDTITDGFIAPLRAIESPGIEKLREAAEEMDEDEFRAYKDETTTRARNYGETDEGLIVGGQVSAYMEDMPTVEELIESINREAVEAHEAVGAGIV